MWDMQDTCAHVPSHHKQTSVLLFSFIYSRALFLECVFIIYDMQKHVNWHVCSLGNRVKLIYMPYVPILLSNIRHTGRNSVMFSFLWNCNSVCESPQAQQDHKAAALPTVTHLQSVSLPSVCSHLISAHTLCLSLSSLRWWDAVCMGHTHAHTQRKRCTVWLLDPACLS